LISEVAFEQIKKLTKLGSHDQIASNMNVEYPPFEDKYKEQCKDLKRTLMGYLDSIQAMIVRPETGAETGVVVGADADAGAGVGAEDTSGSLHTTLPSSISRDMNGYPIAPPITSETKISKDLLEPLYRSYLSIHYRMSFLRMIDIYLYLSLLIQDLPAVIQPGQHPSKK
jgi:hypothetical protein